MYYNYTPKQKVHHISFSGLNTDSHLYTVLSCKNIIICYLDGRNHLYMCPQECDTFGIVCMPLLLNPFFLKRAFMPYNEIWFRMHKKT